LLFQDPKRLLLDMAREHALPQLLRLVVDRLAESPRVALARLWLVQPSEGSVRAGDLLDLRDSGPPWVC